MWTKIDSNRIGSGAPASRSFQSGAAFEGAGPPASACISALPASGLQQLSLCVLLSITSLVAGKLYIFGGVNTANQHLNDLHVLDMEACSWREIGCTSSPKARGNMGAALIGSKVSCSLHCLRVD